MCLSGVGVGTEGVFLTEHQRTLQHGAISLLFVQNGSDF
jgi:hypothetical protein